MVTGPKNFIYYSQSDYPNTCKVGNNISMYTQGPKTWGSKGESTETGYKYNKQTGFRISGFEEAILKNIMGNDNTLTLSDLENIKEGKTKLNTGLPGLYSTLYYRINKDKSDIKNGKYVIEIANSCQDQFKSSFSGEKDYFIFDAVTEQEQAKIDNAKKKAEAETKAIPQKEEEGFLEKIYNWLFK